MTPLSVGPVRLTGPQQEGWHCALCGARLYADRSLGIHRILSCGQEIDAELWACAPSCEAAASARRPLH
ncbi:hypothetical protein AB0B15_24545 [Streptomyces sp. NPDC045456]|uniref:hypothetical protein n=1 Tax=Streptomyces sp. NPDC045456 TaxID=3155254 RepID=UPI0033C1BC0D